MKKKHCLVLLITCMTFFLFRPVAQIVSRTGFKNEHSKVKIFLLGGQSNMSGWTPLSEIANEFKHEYPEAMIWADGETVSGLSRHWMSLIPGLGKSELYFGPELSFGPELAKYFPDEKIALLKCSWAGTDLVTQWRPPSSGRTTGYLYNGFIKSVHEGLAALPVGLEPEIAGMIWMQGESDAILTKTVADEYEYNLTNLINDLRSEFKVPQLPFVIGQISEASAWDAFGSTIRKAQLDVSKNISNTSMIITTDLGFTDPCHYSGMGQITLGKRFAASLNSIITAKGIRSEIFDANEMVHPIVTRVDSIINLNWGNSFPDNAMTSDRYVIRWAGYIRPQESGVYTLYITTDSSVKLWVDDLLIIDGIVNNTKNPLTGQIALNAGVYSSIKLEYIKNTDNASIELDWSVNGNARQPVPSTVFYQNPLPVLDKSRWTIKSCDSQIRTAAAFGGAKGVLDNNYRSFWKTMPDTPFPHEIAIDLCDTLNIAALDYVPNQLDTTAGNALKFSVFTSMDGTDWKCAVDSGVWRNDTNLKTVRFMPVVTRYIKLQVLSSSKATVSASDICLHGVYTKSENKTMNICIPQVDERILISPIPTSNLISIKLNDFSKNEHVRLSIYSLSGQSVYNYEMGTNRDVSFDCRQILKRGGVYILEAKSVTNSFKQKFVYDHSGM